MDPFACPCPRCRAGATGPGVLGPLAASGGEMLGVILAARRLAERAIWAQPSQRPRPCACGQVVHHYRYTCIPPSYGEGGR
jgi:hypothetical protein